MVSNSARRLLLGLCLFTTFCLILQSQSLVEAKKKCPAGTFKKGKNCAYIPCKRHYSRKGKICVKNWLSKGEKCRSGFVKKGRFCVSVPKKTKATICPAGTVLKGGKCVSKAVVAAKAGAKAKAQKQKTKTKSGKPLKVISRKKFDQQNAKRKGNNKQKAKAKAPKKKLPPITCVGHCGSDYQMTRKCLCKLRKFKCRNKLGKKKSCGRGFARNKACKCVREEMAPIKKCTKKCDKNFTLNKKRCECLCLKKCRGYRTPNPKTCKCRCYIECARNLKYDKKNCRCRKIHCKIGTKLRDGKCIAKVSYKCKKGEVLIRGVCRKIKYCPPGYVKNKFRKCVKKCCRGPCSRLPKVCQPVSCGKNKYIIEGKCKLVAKVNCPPKAFFNLLKPRCPNTCEEPVQLTFCKKKWTGPGCSCYPGFLYHKGKCVHPDNCPNKPLCLRDADVMIMLDSSVSIGKRNFYLMKRFASTLVEQLNVDGGKCHRLSVVRYNHETKTFLNFKDYRKYTHSQMIQKVESIPYRPGLTYIGEALHRVRRHEWTEAEGMRVDVPRVLFFLSDGTETNGELDPVFEAQRLRERGVQIVVLKLGGQSPKQKERLYKLAGAGGKVYVFGLRHFSEISRILSRIVSFNCNDFICPTPRLIREKCVGEWRVYNKLEYYKKGQRCVRKMMRNHKKVRCACPPNHDVPGPCVKSFTKVKHITYKYDRLKQVCHETVKTDRARCACPKPEVKPGPCVDEFQTITTIGYILRTSYARGKYCEKRTGSKQVRCGCQKDEVKKGPCTGGFRVVKTTYHIFNKKTKKCRSKKEEIEVRCACPAPTVATKSCIKSRIDVKIHLFRLAKKNKCVVETYVGTEPCKKICPTKSDVGMIVDTSSSMKSEDFQLVKIFMKKLVDTFPIGFSRTRVSVMTFSSANKIFLVCNFLTFGTARPLKERIDLLRFFRGTTHTASALRAYRKSALKRDHGSRLGKEGVQSIVYLITDGVSSGARNPVDEAQKLRAMGVRIVVIMIGKEAAKEEPKKVASPPYEMNMFAVKSFRNLNRIVNKVSDRRCTMKGGVNRVSVREKYEAAIRKEQARQKTKLLNALSGKAFARLVRLDDSDFCRVALDVIGYYSVIAGKKRLDRRNFRSNFREDVSKRLHIKTYEIRRLNFEGNDVKKRIFIRFDTPCPAANTFGALVCSGKFQYAGNNGKNMKWKSILVIGKSTRRVVVFTKRIDGVTSRIMSIANDRLKGNNKVLRQTRALRLLAHARLQQLHRIVYVDETRVVGLARNINKINLKVSSLLTAEIAKQVKNKDVKRIVLKKLIGHTIKLKKDVAKVVGHSKLSIEHSKLMKKICAGGIKKGAAAAKPKPKAADKKKPKKEEKKKAAS